MSDRFAGKRVLVVGAATGIGRAAALHMAGEGAQVAAVDVNDEAGQETASAAPDRVRYWHADVCDGDQVRSSLAAASEWWGSPPEVLLHTAGVLRGASLDVGEFPEEVWDQVLDINLRGPFLVTKEVVPEMLAAGGGVVILVASGAGVVGGSSSFAYGSSKGGMHGLGLVLASRYGDRGLRVHSVCPVSISTPLKRGQLRESAERRGDTESYDQRVAGLHPPERLAPLFTFLASDEAALVSGTIFTR